MGVLRHLAEGSMTPQSDELAKPPRTPMEGYIQGSAARQAGMPAIS